MNVAELVDDGFYVGAVSGHSLYDWGITAVEQGLQHDKLPGLPYDPLADHIWLGRARAAPWELSGAAHVVQPFPFSGVEAKPPNVHAFDVPTAYPVIDANHRLYKLHFASAELEDVAWHTAYSYVGDPYFFGGIALSLLYCAFGLQDRWYQSERATVFCSMLATISLRAGSMPVLADQLAVAIAKRPTERLIKAPALVTTQGHPLAQASAPIALPPSNVTPARFEWWLRSNPAYATCMIGNAT